MENFDGSIELELTAELRALLAAHPTMLNDAYKEVAQALALYHLSSIFEAQVIKANKGDTASAKFLVDFATPTPLTDTRNLESAIWEDLAIALRDSLSLNLSAEDVVIKLLEHAASNAILKRYLVTRFGPAIQSP